MRKWQILLTLNKKHLVMVSNHNHQQTSVYAAYEPYYFVYADVHFILHPCFYDEFDSISKPKKAVSYEIDHSVIDSILIRYDHWDNSMEWLLNIAIFFALALFALDLIQLDFFRYSICNLIWIVSEIVIDSWLFASFLRNYYF